MARETFKKTGDVGALNNNAVYVIDYTEEAEFNDDLPHNSLVVTSKNAAAEINIYVGTPATGTPDYKLQGKGSIVVEPDDGQRFNLVYIENKTGAQLTAGDVIFRVGTVKGV